MGHVPQSCTLSSEISYPSTSSIKVCSPVPDLEILLAVNLHFQVRLTIILACGIFSRANGSESSVLKYNGSNPSLLKISVELDGQINLKQFCGIFTFLQTVFVSFEVGFHSNYHILHSGKADLWQ